MLKIIDKYILREYLRNVFYCITAFSMIHILDDLFGNLSEFAEAEVPFKMIVKFYVNKFLLGQEIEPYIPASLLLATLYTLWEFGRHNELTAMRASGLSLHRLMMPFLGLGLVLSVTTLVMKETISPDKSLWALEYKSNKFKEVTHRKRYNLAHYNSMGRRNWMIDEVDLNNPGHLKGLKITQEREDGSRESITTAEKAEYLDGTWWFFNARVQVFDRNDIPIKSASDSEKDLTAVKEMKNYMETPQHIVNEVKEWDFLTSREMISYLKTHKGLSRKDRAQKECDLHHRLAMSWACLIVTLFAIPVGAGSQRQNALHGIIWTLGIFFAFYTLTQAGVFAGKRGLISPFLGAWLANIVFLIMGIRMIRKMR